MFVENVLIKTIHHLLWHCREKKITTAAPVAPPAPATSSKPIEQTENKWKMMFAKDSKKEIPAPKQYAFNQDDEAESDGGRESRSRRKSPDRRNTSSTYASTSSRSQLQPPLVNTGPSYLDKFGSFRRAANVMPEKPPEPPADRRSPSRSRSRSRSHSRSHRRSNSRSRSRSHRRSRSYSRSRSRSGSFNGRRRWRSNFRPRNHNYRVGQFNRSNNFRDFKYRGRDRWNNRGNGWGNRNRNFRDNNRYRRSASYSNESDNGRRSHDRRSPPPPSPPKGNPFSGPGGEQSVEEIERMLDKAKKEKQETMLERNRDLVKTTQ